MPILHVCCSVHSGASTPVKVTAPYLPAAPHPRFKDLKHAAA